MKEKKLNMKLLFSIVLLIACTISITSCREKKERTKKGYFDYGEEISKGINQVLDGLQSDEGFIDPDDTEKAALKVIEYAKQLEKEGKITKYLYWKEKGSVTLIFPDGGAMMYYPEYEGTMSGGLKNPFSVMAIDNIASQDAIAYNAVKLIDQLEEYNMNRTTVEDTSFDNIADLLQHANRYRAIFWMGHGAYGTATNPSTGKEEHIVGFVLGAAEKEELSGRWYNDYQKGRIKVNKDNNVIITPYFIEKYLSKTKGGLFVVGACCGLADGGTMAKRFISKGFDVYIGTSDNVSYPYAEAFIKSFAKNLIKRDSSGNFVDAEVALLQARKDCKTIYTAQKTFGGTKAQFYMSGDSKHDFRLVPRKYTLKGVISEKESNNPIPGVNITIKNKKYSWAEDVKCVTDKGGQFSAENVFEGENLVILEKKGYQSPHYKVSPENEVAEGSNVVTFDRKMTGIYEQQLLLIAEKYDSWNLYNDPDFNRVAPSQYSLAVTDIDENGRLELFLHSGWGSGSFSCFKLYEVNETLDGMDLKYNNYNGAAGADIGYEQFDVYNYQERNILIFKDYLREGWMHEEMTLLPAYLKNNEFKLQSIGKSVTETDLDSNNNRQSETTYYNSSDKSITKAQFESLPETLYPGAKKGTMYFRWIPDYNFSGNIFDDLNTSWNGFFVEWNQ